MNILIVTQFFYPENFIINNLCKFLVDNGHSITVVTGKPNYPQGKFYKNYGLCTKIKDNTYGATVYRLPLIPRGNGSNIMLFLNYISFAITSSLFVFFYRKKFEFSFVFAVSPIIQALPAIMHKIMYKTPFYLWVLDLWPESLTVGNRVTSKTSLKLLNYIVKFIYSSADRIYISSNFMKNSIKKYQNEDSSFDIRYFPNWIRDFKSVYYPEKYKLLIPKGFNIMLAGNIGASIDFPNIINAALNLIDKKDINFLILGSGSKETQFKNEVVKNGLSKKIFFLGRYPPDEMPHFYIHADLMLISLSDNELYKYTVPEKLQSYMAMKKTIVGMVSGESNEIINNSGAGLAANSGDHISLANNIKLLYEMSETKRINFGKNGFDFALKNFDLSNNIKKVLN